MTQPGTEPRKQKYASFDIVLLNMIVVTKQSKTMFLNAANAI